MSDLRAVTVLIPSHGLEDFPTELAEQEAAGILNAFAIARHPDLLAKTRIAPEWGRADEPPHHLEGHLVLVPACCEGWMPHEWPEQAREQGAWVIENCSSREDYEASLRECFPEGGKASASLIQDFYALGTAWLLIELLTRKMHYYSSLDEHNFQRDQLAAADAAVTGDETAAKAHLKGCFETLMECREHFYPVDCYLIDLCLLNPEVVDEHFLSTLQSPDPVNFLLKAEHLFEISEQHPEACEKLKEAVHNRTAEIVGGDRYEKPLSTSTLSSLIWDLQAGRALYQQLLERTPTTWARKRYGFSTQMPQILSQMGFHSAFHLALDDGLYPDEEQSKLRWEGCDGTVIDAVSRIPLAADGAGSYLRFADRMAESMQDDQVAGLLFARWPEVQGVWFRDLQRVSEYAPVFGRFATLDDFIQTTDHSGRLSRHDERDYLSPYFLQAVAFGEPDPISRFRDALQLRHTYDVANWLSRMHCLLSRKPIDDSEATCREWETRVELSGPDLPATESQQTTDEDQTPAAMPDIAQDLNDWKSQAAQQLTELVTYGGKESRGLVVFNSLLESQTAVVPLTGFRSPPEQSEHVKAVQFDDRTQAAVVEIPGAGFVWLAESTGDVKVPAATVPSAEDFTLRNEFFEVLINETTGGIQHLKGYGRSPNRLSQHVAFRFLRERTFQRGEEPPEEIRTNYSTSRLLSCEVTSSGPALGEIVTECELLDPQEETVLARCRSTYRVWRSRPVVEIELELTPEQLPDGDPWSCYFASRFAWKNESASLTRGILQGAHGLQGERFEAPYYLEIADGDLRTTILPDGLPFQRRSGPRMLDSILISEGETTRKFRFWIAFDEPYPMQAANRMLMPPVAVPSERTSASASGWFFRMKEKNVQMLSLQPIVSDPHADSGPPEGYSVTLLETEGRNRRVKLRPFQAPLSARKRDLLGNLVQELSIVKDAVIIDMRGHELAHVDLVYSEPSAETSDETPQND